MAIQKNKKKKRNLKGRLLLDLGQRNTGGGRGETKESRLYGRLSENANEEASHGFISTSSPAEVGGEGVAEGKADRERRRTKKKKKKKSRTSRKEKKGGAGEDFFSAQQGKTGEVMYKLRRAIKRHYLQ